MTSHKFKKSHIQGPKLGSLVVVDYEKQNNVVKLSSFKSNKDLVQGVYNKLQEQINHALSAGPVKHLQLAVENVPISAIEAKRIKSINLCRRNRWNGFCRNMLRNKYPLSENQCNVILKMQESGTIR